MKRFFRPYLSLLIIGSLAFTATSCKDDEPEPIVEQELITTLTIELVPEGKGQPITATFSDPDGPGGNSPTISTVNLSPSTTYNASVTVRDDSPNGEGDLTPEIQAEGHEHELFYTASQGLNLTVSKTDLDKNNRPIGLKATVVTGSTSSGTLKVTLKHQPNGLKGNTSDITKGETDVEVNFPVVIQ